MGKSVAFEPKSKPAELDSAAAEHVEGAVAALTLEQKVRLLTGADFWSTHDEPAIGLRRMVVSDGPAGVRGETWDEREPSTNLPSPTAWAATWDEDLVAQLAALLATDARRKGVHVVLGPTVNLHRSPLGGRHFECFSEDPLLSGRIGAAYVASLQEHGVGATPKHYVANDSETERFTVDVRVGERALRELYLAPFELIVRNARPWMVMAAYNAVNGVTMTEHDLLRSPLADEWAFDGVVVSDWTATRSTKASARAALDLVMPGPKGPWGEALVAAVEDGSVPAELIDAKVRRLLRLAARVGALEWLPRPEWKVTALTRDETTALIRKAATSAMTLVRNEGDILPLEPAQLSQVALIGPNIDPGRTQGGGSATVLPPYTVSPLDGLTAALSPRARVVDAVGHQPQRGLAPFRRDEISDPTTGLPGLRVRFLDRFANITEEEHRETSRLVWLGGSATQADQVQVATEFHATQSGSYGFGVAGVGAFRLVVDGVEHFDEEIAHPGGDPAAALFDPPERLVHLDLDAGQRVTIEVTHTASRAFPAVALSVGVERPSRTDEDELAYAVNLARDSDVAVVVVGTTERVESEGFDRTTLSLPGRQDELVRAVAAVNRRTVVVVNSGGPVLMPWRDEVAAVLVTWFPGQEFGHALAEVLLGKAEPGGRLPTTWPAREADVPVLSTTPSGGQLSYREGLHVGYRAWAKDGAAPAYPFGYGLGYTSWEIGSAEAPDTLTAGSELTVWVRVRNTGERAGRHVVQAYLSRADSTVERPARWLAGFTVVTADPGEEVLAEVRVEPLSFAHWATGWHLETGPFQLHVGHHVDDLPVERTVTITAAD